MRVIFRLFGSPLGAGKGRKVADFLDERGFIETQFLATYMVVFVTMLAFTLGICFGVWKQAQAKYTWMAEAANFAAQAANVRGDIKEAKLNEGKARKYFAAAMKQMVGNYFLREFRAVAPGEPVPHVGVAWAPGYVVTCDIPVSVIDMPLLGHQQIVVPMRYYAVVKSGQIKKK